MKLNQESSHIFSASVFLLCNGDATSFGFAASTGNKNMQSTSRSQGIGGDGGGGEFLSSMAL